MELLRDSLSAELVMLKLHLRNEDKNLRNTITRYYRKLNQCNLIISRINQNSKQHKLLHDKFMHFQKTTKRPRVLKGKEAELYHKTQDLLFQINFDTEDYFIHARILLDRVTQIIGCFIEDLPRKAKRSFAQHRNHLIKKECSDLNYTTFVREETKWFDIMLLVHRNDLIVHDEITSRSGSTFSPGTMHSIMRMRPPDEKESNEIMALLTKIRDEHSHDIPEIRNEENLWELLKKLDINAQKLEQNEIKDIFGIHKKVGGELPYVNEINKKIQDFLDFTSSHFTKLRKILNYDISEFLPTKK